jgi:aminoglycoside phosphotransferase (APT) family kinase protein
MIEVRGRKKIAEGRQAEIFAWEPGTVLKLFRGQEFAAAAQREATAMNAVHASAGLAPSARHITEIDGRPALIMERVDGIDLLTEIGTRPWRLWRAASAMGEAHAALHATPAPDALPSLRPVLRHQIASPRVPEGIARAAAAAIEDLPDNDRLLHGDFYPGNIILTARGPVVIDWPAATRGDPTADVARTVLLLRLGEPPPGAPALVRLGSGLGRRIILRRYLRTYRRAHLLSEDELQRWLLPIAASRIAEGIDGERTKLLTWIDKLMRAAS